jgi:hypothetical protein
MENPQSIQYFERREEEERLAALNASDKRAAETHRALAARYHARAKGRPLREASEEESGGLSSLPTDFRILP